MLMRSFWKAATSRTTSKRRQSPVKRSSTGSLGMLSRSDRFSGDGEESDSREEDGARSAHHQGGRADDMEDDADSDDVFTDGEGRTRRHSSKRDSEMSLVDQDLLLSELPSELDLVLDPDGDLAYYWMGAVALAVLYNYWVIILRLAFVEMREEGAHQLVLCEMDLFCDLVYFLDLLVQHRTGYLEEGMLVLDPYKLSSHYRSQPWFWRDVFAILPLQSVCSLMLGIVPFHTWSQLSGSSCLLLRLSRLLKLHSLAQFFDVTDSRISNPNRLRAFKLTMYLGVVIHWVGCFYYMLSEYEGLGTNDWVYSSAPAFRDFASKYIRCMYWSTMTLTTIGGASNPVTNLEYIFTGVTFLIGVFVFAAVVGNVGDVISNLNAARTDFQNRMDSIKLYMTHRKVPEALQSRVKRWAGYAWHRTQALDEVSLLEMLPERLRAEIAIHVHLETLRKVTIFEDCEQGLLCELVLKLRSQIYSPGDYICRTGETGREMYIINHGTVQILVPENTTGERKVVATLTKGNSFGEISVLKLDGGGNKRTADVISLGYSELLVLSRKDLLSALIEYPDAKKLLEAQAKERLGQNKEARGATDADGFEASQSTNKKSHRGGSTSGISPGKELAELRSIIEELRTFDSQCDDLQRRLSRRQTELTRALRRVSVLESLLDSAGLLSSMPQLNGELTSPMQSDASDTEQHNPALAVPSSPHARALRRRRSSASSAGSPRRRRRSRRRRRVEVPAICVNGVEKQAQVSVNVEMPSSETSEGCYVSETSEVGRLRVDSTTAELTGSTTDCNTTEGSDFDGR
ncbi:CNGA3 [Branchiostoma lanceolatum]|uniref:CNGA3 protein n=1 Tax=Branchiostoma lanceolatum TaxID=7740 RepID=A0A8J9ZVY4_BRALA|nr:CNGA3 [Branchiostoma lanceolatum]